MLLCGSKVTRTLSDRQTFGAQDIGFQHDAPKEDDAEGDSGLYSKEHGSEAHELRRCDGALF